MPKSMVYELADMLYAGALTMNDEILSDFTAELLNTFTGRIVCGLFPNDKDIFLTIPQFEKEIPFDLSKVQLVVLEVDEKMLYIMGDI